MVEPVQNENEKVGTKSDDETNKVGNKRPRDESLDKETTEPFKKARIEETDCQDNDSSVKIISKDSIVRSSVDNCEVQNDAEKCEINTDPESKFESTTVVEKNNIIKEDTVNDSKKNDLEKHVNKNIENCSNEIETNKEKNPETDNEHLKNKTDITKDDAENMKGNEKDEKNTNKNEKGELKNVTDKDSDKNLSHLQNEKVVESELAKDNSNESITKDERTDEKKKKYEDSDIINGMELTVECASDKESSSENEITNDSKPKIKTVIVREKPNDSEVDESSSEAEKSDSYKIIEPKSKVSKTPTNSKIPSKQKKAKGKKRSAFSKAPASESENTPESSSDEDYSPVSKRFKKSPTSKKSNEKNEKTELKKGKSPLPKTTPRRGRPPKNSNEIKDVSDMEIEKKTGSIKKKDAHRDEKKSNQSEKLKNNENESHSSNESASNSFNSGSEDEKSSNEKTEKSKSSGKKTSTRNVKKIANLKKFIRAAGIRVKCYNTLLKDCKTDAAKARRLHEFLGENGIVGTPTLQKCEKLRIKNETIKEIQELDTSNIVSESRPKRSRSAKKPQKEDEDLASKSVETIKKIRKIVDSD